MFQGGWGFLPHLNLLINRENETTAYLAEKNSSELVKYSGYKSKKGYIYLRPKIKNNRASGNLSSRKKPIHNKLKVRNTSAVLCLPDGTKRYYKGQKYYGGNFWRLTRETLPSRHQVIYRYAKEWPCSYKLTKIELQNPKRTKTFASIDFNDTAFEEERRLTATTSEGKSITYEMMPEFKKRTYLNKVSTQIRPQECAYYEPARKGIGARINSIQFGTKEQFQVEYYKPSSSDKEKKYSRKSKNHTKLDKVKTLKLPHPETGESVEFANFIYHKDHTIVKDNEGVVTRYNHDGERLQSIDYFDTKSVKVRSIQFDWKEDQLRTKRLYDGNEQLQFSKIFVYDKKGDIIKEIWRDEQGSCKPISRVFSYTKNRLVKQVKELGGLSYQHEYLPKTDLITKKTTSYKGKVLLREFFLYNDDNLLVKTIVDDGTSRSINDLTDMTERKVQAYNLDPETGLPLSMTELYFDQGKKQIHLCHGYTYNEKKELIQEKILDAHGKEKYALFYEYDDFGHLIKKTTPLGRVNTYSYDEQGFLKESKEVGSPKKTYQYDKANRLIETREGEKIAQCTYDLKGRLISQSEGEKSPIEQVYDCFGRSIETHFPKSIRVNTLKITPTKLVQIVEVPPAAIISFPLEYAYFTASLILLIVKI